MMKELRAVIDRFREEYQMTYAEAVGCLELLKAELLFEALEDEEDDDE